MSLGGRPSIVFPWQQIMSLIAPGKKLIDQRMVELEKLMDQGEAPSGYLTYLLSSGQLSPEELYGSIAELLLAGVDTVG